MKSPVKKWEAITIISIMAIVIVDAMCELSKMYSSSKAYAINSHGVQDAKTGLMTFFIGSDQIDGLTDVSPLRSGLNNCDVFIGACRVGGLNGDGYGLIESFSKQTQSRVIAPKDRIRVGYSYDGSDYLNYTLIDKNLVFSNQFSLSVQGHKTKDITNVTIDRNRGIAWDSDFNIDYLFNCPNKPFFLDY